VQIPSLSDKERLRREARARRRAFVADLDVDARLALEADLAARAAPYLAGARVISSYAPMGAEIDPAPVLAAVEGALALLPWFENRDAVMEFRSAEADREPGPFGIPQPRASAPAMEPDVMLVPLVAADRRCNRIGQGQGHFDRALAAHRLRGPVTAIGLAWDAQIFDELPPDPWDERLDLVITPTRTFRADDGTR
jgi:5-formyltetrahydrofolate cyclo-ligase